MRVLGLDPSLRNYGWALHETTAKGKSRCVERGRIRTEKRHFKYEITRYIHIREELRSLILRLKPDRMGIEHPVYGETYSEGMYGLYLFSLDCIFSCKQDLMILLPPQVKSFARELIKRPDGWDMKKPDMVEAAKADTGGKGQWDHNEADAYHVARAAGRFWELYDGTLNKEDLSEYERDTFTLIKTYKRGRKAGRTEMKGMLYREDEKFFLFSKGEEHAKEKDHQKDGKKVNKKSSKGRRKQSTDGRSRSRKSKSKD